jgi:hypothetical protein
MENTGTNRNRGNETLNFKPQTSGLSRASRRGFGVDKNKRKRNNEEAPNFTQPQTSIFNLKNSPSSSIAFGYFRLNLRSPE